MAKNELEEGLKPLIKAGIVRENPNSGGYKLTHVGGLIKNSLNK